MLNTPAHLKSRRPPSAVYIAAAAKAAYIAAVDGAEGRRAHAVNCAQTTFVAACHQANSECAAAQEKADARTCDGIRRKHAIEYSLLSETVGAEYARIRTEYTAEVENAYIAYTKADPAGAARIAKARADAHAAHERAAERDTARYASIEARRIEYLRRDKARANERAEKRAEKRAAHAETKARNAPVLSQPPK